MTATQASTPGPLDAKHMILQLAKLQREQAGWASRLGQPGCAARLNAADNAEALAWAVKKLCDHSADAGNMVAPTAPVEASGSERLWPVGSWLSAALDDPKVCEAMKADIREWFDNGGHLRPQPSGKTREHGPKCWGKTSASDEMAHCYCGSEDSPQLREAVLKGVGKINGDGWKDTTTEGEVVFVWNAEKPTPYAPGQYPRVGNEGWSASTSQYDFTPATAKDVPAILALLSARPLALGGQQGDHAALVDELREELKIAISPQWHPRLAARVDSILSRLSTTPARAEAHPLGRLVPEEITDEDRAWAASEIEKIKDMPSPWEDRPNLDRAEAQDEGAAGDFETAEAMAEAWSDRVEIQHMVETTSAVFAKCTSPEILSRFRQQMMAVIQQAYIEGVGARIEAMRSHPSPTPAADADRVRIAVAAFLKAEDEARDRLREAGTPLPSTPEVDALREALAALKSTAAKEGGKV
ncbi:hypothetical protein [Brevundimonas sp. Marseille-Q4549]